MYTLRGRVEMVPESGKPTTAFIVYHEPIDDFLAPDGKVGMNSMSMPFPLAKGVSMSGIAPGDVVEVRLAVWTAKGDLGYEARAVKKLPPETALHFGLASPPLPGVKP